MAVSQEWRPGYRNGFLGHRVPMWPMSYLSTGGSVRGPAPHLRARVLVAYAEGVMDQGSLSLATPAVPVTGTSSLYGRVYAYVDGSDIPTSKAPNFDDLSAKLQYSQGTSYEIDMVSNRRYRIWRNDEVWVDATAGSFSYRATATRTTFDIDDNIFLNFEAFQDVASLNPQSGTHWVRVLAESSSSDPEVTIHVRAEIWSNLWVWRNRRNPYYGRPLEFTGDVWRRYDLTGADIRNQFYTGKATTN